MENIYNLTKEDLESYLININDKKFRSTQIYDWLYVKRVKSFDEMTNLSKTLISKLKKVKYFMDVIIIQSVILLVGISL